MLSAGSGWQVTSRGRPANHKPFQSRGQNSNILDISIDYFDESKQFKIVVFAHLMFI
jgi:hypothetical protein